MKVAGQWRSIKRGWSVRCTISTFSSSTKCFPILHFERAIVKLARQTFNRTELIIFNPELALIYHWTTQSRITCHNRYACDTLLGKITYAHTSLCFFHNTLQLLYSTQKFITFLTGFICRLLNQLFLHTITINGNSILLASILSVISMSLCKVL